MIAQTKFLSNTLTLPPGEPNRPARPAPLRRSSRTCTMSAPSGSGLQHRTCRFHDSSTARTARRSRPVRDWPRAPLAAGRCSLKRSAVVGAASRSFAETAGLRLGRLAWKCCATCFHTKPTIAGRCVCSRISSDSRCRTRWRTGSGIGKSCGKSAGGLAAPATILRESLKGTDRPGMGCDGGDIERSYVATEKEVGYMDFLGEFVWLGRYVDVWIHAMDTRF